MELPVTAPVVPWAFRVIEQIPVVAETPRLVHLLAVSGMLVSEETLIPSCAWRGYVSVFRPEVAPGGVIRRTVRRQFGDGERCAIPRAG